jgi:hypothetical protein
VALRIATLANGLPENQIVTIEALIDDTETIDAPAAIQSIRYGRARSR